MIDKKVIYQPLPKDLFFPPDNVWNTPIPLNAKIDANSDSILNFHSGGNLNVIAYVECALPYNVVDTGQVSVDFITIKGLDESYDDPGGIKDYPYNEQMLIQNGPYLNSPKKDQHFLVVDIKRGKEKLYEVYQLKPSNG